MLSYSLAVLVNSFQTNSLLLFHMYHLIILILIPLDETSVFTVFSTASTTYLLTLLAHDPQEARLCKSHKSQENSLPIEQKRKEGPVLVLVDRAARLTV